MSERPRPERLVALFVTVFWAAVVFAVDGLLAVLLDRDPISGDVGPYYSIIAFAIAGFVLWMLLSGTAEAGIRRSVRSGPPRGVYFVFLAVAGIGWGLPLVVGAGAQPLRARCRPARGRRRRRDLGRHPLAALAAGRPRR